MTYSAGAPTLHPSITASPDPSVGSEWTSPPSRHGESSLSSPGEAFPPIDHTRTSHAYRAEPPTRLEGWPLLAELMTATPAFEAFPRFRSLNVRNLLYYQVELAKLEFSLRDRELDDMNPSYDDPRPESTYKGSELHMKPENMIDSDSVQWEHVKGLRKLLREYNEALLQYAQVSALAEPTGHNMRELVTWLWARNLGDGHVRGLGARKWGEYNPRNRNLSPRRIFEVLVHFFWSPVKMPQVQDLVAPRAGKTPDRLSRWISEEVIPLFWDICEWRKGRKQPGGGKSDVENNEKQQENKGPHFDERISDKHIQTFFESTITGFTAGISTLVACMLPIAAIFLLAVVKDLQHRLYMIASFSFAFAFLLMMLTEATRVQIFTATAAFLAVLVVFIPAGAG